MVMTKIAARHRNQVSDDAEGMLRVTLVLFCGALVNDFSDQSFFYLIYNIGLGLGLL